MHSLQMKEKKVWCRTNCFLWLSSLNLVSKVSREPLFMTAKIDYCILETRKTGWGEGNKCPPERPSFSCAKFDIESKSKTG